MAGLGLPAVNDKETNSVNRVPADGMKVKDTVPGVEEYGILSCGLTVAVKTTGVP